MKQDSKPLWQRLNKERTPTNWEVTSFKEGDFGLCMEDAGDGIAEKMKKVDAEMSALAVNNLASLAEGYTKFIEDYLKGEESLDVICRRHFETAKEALNKIS